MPIRKLVFDPASGSFVPAMSQPASLRYLRGPLPLDWLETALVLPGQAINVGLAIWFTAGVRKSQRDLSVSNELVAQFGVTRWSKYRALAQLKRAGLIAIKQTGKSAPRVTLLKTGSRATQP
jgi:hypothetical protein